LGARVDFGLGMGPATVDGLDALRKMARWCPGGSGARGGSRRVWGVVQALCANGARDLAGAGAGGEVDDLVQEVFVAAMRQVHTLRDVTCFGGMAGDGDAENLRE